MYKKTYQWDCSKCFFVLFSDNFLKWTNFKIDWGKRQWKYNVIVLLFFMMNVRFLFDIFVLNGIMTINRLSLLLWVYEIWDHLLYFWGEEILSKLMNAISWWISISIKGNYFRMGHRLHHSVLISYILCTMYNVHLHLHLHFTHTDTFILVECKEKNLFSTNSDRNIKSTKPLELLNIAKFESLIFTSNNFVLILSINCNESKWIKKKKCLKCVCNLLMVLLCI